MRATKYNLNFVYTLNLMFYFLNYYSFFTFSKNNCFYETV